MCGIAGIWHLNNAQLDSQKLQTFCDSMFHRGPDGAGYELFDNNTLGLAHRRLSILDLSDAAAQPFHYLEKKYWITYNGEVFNFEEIKTELIQNGFSFRSTSDTEVIIAAYIKWGSNCLHKFNGMWAFAIWNETEKELFIARDRFGIKPLYFHFEPNKIFAFASETYAFGFLQHFNKQLNQQNVELYFEDIYAFEGYGQTLYKNIYSILPGHCAIIKKNSDHINQKRWFHIQEHLHTNIPPSFEEQTEEFLSLFKDSCKLRLISDVPVATALSGGLDSSSVYATVNHIIQNENLTRSNKDSQRAFVATFKGLPVDEKEYAENVIQHIHGNGNFIEFNGNNVIEKLESETKLMDAMSPNPIHATSSVYRSMREAGIVVSLDGHGVDEMLYGYKDMVYNLFNSYFKTNNLQKAKEIKDVLFNLYHENYKNELKTKLEKQLIDINSPTNILKYKLKNTARKILRKNEIYKEEFLPLKSINSLGQPYDFSSFDVPQRMVYNEFFEGTLPSLLKNFDAAGMMNSIEIRMPFMDWRLVTYVFSLPIESKIGNGFTKRIVREAMKKYLPESVRTRTYKVGIGTPWDAWSSNILKEYICDFQTTEKYKIAKEMLTNVYRSPNSWEVINLAMLL